MPRPTREPTPLQLLLSACRSGGDADELRRVLRDYDYSEAELTEAIETLHGTVASAAENMLAKRHHPLLEAARRSKTRVRHEPRSSRKKGRRR